MGLFLNSYVRVPLQSLLSEAITVPPPLAARWNRTSIDISIGNASLIIHRNEQLADEVEDIELPDDIAEDIANG